MDLSDLKVFRAVARTGAMNRAAGELHTVQSNVTARIRQLEQDLDVTLFDRHARGVTLTAAGERLLPYADAAERLIAEARRAARDDGVPSGALAIGSLETTAALHLSGLLTAFARAYPAVDLSLSTGTTEELVAGVLAGTVEGAFVCGPVDHPDLVADMAFEEELVAVTAPGTARLGDLTSGGTVKVVVLRVGCSYRRRLEEVLAARGVTGLRVSEFGTLETIVGCVAAGLGVTLLPRAMVAQAAAEGRVRVHSLTAAEGRVRTLFIRRRDARLSSALASFLALAVPHRTADAAD